MPRVKKVKIEEPKVELKVAPEVAEKVVEAPKAENPNVKVIELNGRKVLQVFNPVEGTTHNEPFVE